MFEVGVSMAFRAFHRMPDHPPPENERHPHDYRVDVVVERDGLDDRGMVCDLDVVSGRLRSIVSRVRERDLAGVFGSDGVTVEAFASWIHGELADAMRDEGAELLRVRVWESDAAFGGRHERLA
jgi:6-pyruvoyltetrahydropterin/6-carboxytetrahydropterin synthase